jgi:hypothetical protein
MTEAPIACAGTRIGVVGRDEQNRGGAFWPNEAKNYKWINSLVL